MKNLARPQAPPRPPAVVDVPDVGSAPAVVPTATAQAVAERRASGAVAAAPAGESAPAVSAGRTPSGPLTSWHPDEQPRERLLRLGPEALATSELLAILLRTGTPRANACDIARDLLRGVDGRLRELGSRNWRDLARAHGVGPVKAVTLVAALELGRRRGGEADAKRPLVRGSGAAYEILAPRLRDLDREECWVLLLNTASRALGCERVSVGGLDGTVVDVRSVMALGLRHGAAAIVLAHNHPSGAARPSERDVAVTRAVAEAGRVMRMELRDHLVVAGRRYFSFADAGLLGGR